jgi:hypothetical protein
MIIELEEIDDNYDKPAKTIDTETADRDALAAALVEVHGWVVNLEKIILRESDALARCGLTIDGSADLPLVVIKPDKANATFTAALNAFHEAQDEENV